MANSGQGMLQHHTVASRVHLCGPVVMCEHPLCAG